MKFPTLTLRAGPLIGAFGFLVFSLYDAAMKYILMANSIFSALAITQTVSVVAVVVFVGAVKRNLTLLKPKKPWVVLVYAAFFTVGMVSFLYAVSGMPLADLFVIILAVPALTVGMARFYLGEPLRRYQIISVSLGCVGVLIMLQFWHAFARGEGAYRLSALLAAGGNVVISCCSSIFIRKYASDESGFALAFAGAVVLAILFLLLAGSEISNVTPEGWGLGVVAGILAVCGVALLNKAYALGPAGLVAPVQYSQMLWASLLGFIVWQEVPTVWVYLGGSLVLAGGLVLAWPQLYRGNFHRRSRVS